ncbi:hypothetical protein L2E82_17279 [Cichorium intybus]|uniref:Uncharacterized protein n=1 Tax=Cichorium intybus TaxID=13427 RepID=A0ACB9F8H0_CICIN|nr:hypothetical protein L2E82_17279 [Cichorium intybus]
MNRCLRPSRLKPGVGVRLCLFRILGFQLGIPCLVCRVGRSLELVMSLLAVLEGEESLDDRDSWQWELVISSVFYVSSLRLHIDDALRPSTEVATR